MAYMQRALGSTWHESPESRASRGCLTVIVGYDELLTNNELKPGV